MEKEIWKDIPGYEGYYQASNEGKVRSRDNIYYYSNRKCRRKGRILKIFDNGRGYKKVWLMGGKSCLVHRLVAISFIDNPECKPHINHIDGNPGNNTCKNLEWCTRSDNILHAFNVLGRKRGMRGKFNIGGKKIIQILNGNIIKTWNSFGEINRELGYSQGNLCECCKGKYNSRMYGYEWRYL